jgi:hypothetical protein
MALSRGLALAIVTVVENDPECKRRIDSPLSTLLPDDWGLAGGIRNFGFALAETYKALADGRYSAQPSAAQDDLVCYGIRDATIDALKTAILGTAPGGSLSLVADVGYVIRDNPIVHTATLVTLVDKSDYVFDWHATLNPGNPLIYPSAKAFEENRDSVHFAAFTSFP